MADKKSFRFLLSKPFHRGKHSKQKDSNPVAPFDNVTRELTTVADVSKAPQTEPTPLMKEPTARHDPVPTPTDGSARENSVQRESAFEPKLLWDRAYDSLREDAPGLVEAYEKILSCELSGTPTTSPASKYQQNIIKQKDIQTRRSQMNQLVDKGLAKTKHEAEVKQEAGHVMDVVLYTNNVISTALWACPEAGLVWAGVTFALHILVNPIRETETNRKGIRDVIDRMNWYWSLSSHLLEERNPNRRSYAGLRSGLENQVMELYKELLSYQMKSVCSYYQKRGLVWLGDLVQLHNWEGKLNSIEKAEAVFRESSDQYNTQQSIDMNEQRLKTLGDISSNLQELPSLQRDLQEEKENNMCMKDLILTDPAKDMERIEDSKGLLLPESFTWILRHRLFINWRDNKSTRLLWIRGDPGKGKTMLLIGIVREFFKSPLESSLQSFFFCQATDTNLNNATAVLRGLVYQILVQQPSLISHLRKEYDKAGSKLFEGGNAFISISTILTNILRDPGLNRVYLVVDALDECQSGLEQLLRFIVKSLSDPSSQVKWLVSSRHKIDIEEQLSLEETKADLNLEKDVDDQVSHAVKAYIGHKLHNLFARYQRNYETTLDYDVLVELQKVENEVAEELHRKAGHTFLWVALVFEQIDSTECDADDVCGFVRKMPVGLHEMYNQMMRQIIRQQSKYFDYCKKVLLVAVNSYRPLRLSEMVTLAALPKLADESKVIRRCGLLSLREEDKIIYFVHQSAKDYLTQHAEPEILSDIFPDGHAEGHHTILSRSLRSMSQILRRDIYSMVQPGFRIADVHRPLQDPLVSIRYACVYWVDHLCEIKTSQNSIYFCDNGDVDTFLKKHFLCWLEALSLMGSISDGVFAIARLVDLLRASQDSQLFKLAQDAHRFVLFNRGVIENTPLQLYYSALIFSPAGSLTRHSFKNEEPHWITKSPAMEPTWGACLQTLEGHDGFVQSVAFSSDSTCIASGSWDGTVKIWDASNGACIQTLEGHNGFVQSAAFSSDSTYIASGSGDQTIKTWNAKNGACLQTLECHNGSIQSVVFSSDNMHIASGSDDQTVKIWNTSNGSCLKTLKGHSGWVKSVVFSSDNTCIASGSDDKTVKIWDASNGACIQTLEGHNDSVQSIAFSLDSMHIASGSEDKTVKIWDASNGACIQTLEGHNGFIQSVVFSSDSMNIASGSDDQTIKIWNASNGVCLQTLKGHNHSVKSVAFSSDDTYITSGSDDQTIKIWDVNNSANVQILESHNSWVLSVAFSPDSTHIASGSEDHTIKIWETSNGACVHTLEGHNSWVFSVAFSPDSTHIASGSWDETVKIWDVNNGVCVQTFEGQGFRVTFNADTSCFHTERGIVPWDTTSNTWKDANISGMSQHHPYGLDTDRTWITWNGQNMLWLPSEYRPSIASTTSSAMVIGCRSGRVLIFNFSNKAPLPDSVSP